MIDLTNLNTGELEWEFLKEIPKDIFKKLTWHGLAPRVAECVYMSNSVSNRNNVYAVWEGRSNNDYVWQVTAVFMRVKYYTSQQLIAKYIDEINKKTPTVAVSVVEKYQLKLT